MTRRRPLTVRDDGRPATPIAIQVSASDGGLASVALRRDPYGWTCSIDGHRFYLTRVRSGPATPTTWEE